MAKPWYVVDNINEIDSPALLIYKERVQHNIAKAISVLGSPSRLRPHVKTHKSAEITSLMLQAGISKFKCATIAEAEMLGQCSAPDVLLAYQPTGPKIERFLKLIQLYPSTQFSCLVDSVDAVTVITKPVKELGVHLNVFIDVNVGMNRSGVLPRNAAMIYEACSEAGIAVVGLHGYDGHINETNIALRKKEANEAYKQIENVRQELSSKGMLEPIIVLGGSPTFFIHAQIEDVECSPGTFVFWDRNYQELLPDMDFLPAALIVTRVVSVLNEKRFCLDLGHKSIAAENALNRRVYFMNAEGLHLVSQSEEHLVVETKDAHSYKVSNVLYGMPFHVCPTCALYDTAYVAENGLVKDEWRIIARDRKISV